MRTPRPPTTGACPLTRPALASTAPASASRSLPRMRQRPGVDDGGVEALAGADPVPSASRRWATSRACSYWFSAIATAPTASKAGADRGRDRRAPRPSPGPAPTLRRRPDLLGGWAVRNTGSEAQREGPERPSPVIRRCLDQPLDLGKASFDARRRSGGCRSTRPARSHGHRLARAFGAPGPARGRARGRARRRPLECLCRLVAAAPDRPRAARTGPAARPCGASSIGRVRGGARASTVAAPAAAASAARRSHSTARPGRSSAAALAEQAAERARLAEWNATSSASSSSRPAAVACRSSQLPGGAVEPRALARAAACRTRPRG